MDFDAYLEEALKLRKIENDIPILILEPINYNGIKDLKGLYLHGVFGSGKTQPKWYSDGFTKTKTPEERQKWRSKTLPNVARVIAEQWTIQIAAEENLFDENEWNIIGKDYLEVLG